LLDYIYNYKRSYDAGKLNIKDGISKDLFIFSPEYEKDGYGQYTSIQIKADDTYTLENLSRVKHWYDFLDAFNLSAEYQSDAYRNIQAITPIDKKDVTLSKDAFCKKYFVSQSDYENIIKSVNKRDETTYLFRFSQSSFMSLGLKSQVGDGYVYETDYNYAAMQTVYLDMNISSITCRKDDVYHTFAVAANPIDAVADIEPPPEEFDKTGWWKDKFESVKDWFEMSKSALIIAAIVILAVVLMVLIIITLVKLAPSFAMLRISRSQSPSKQRSKSRNKTKNKSASNAGRSHKNGKKTSLSKSQ